MKLKYLVFLVSILQFEQCVNKNERDFLPAKSQTSADLKPVDLITEREVSFSKEIKLIVDNICLDCHKPNSTNPNSPGDYYFTDYAGLKIKADQKYLGSTISKLEERIISNDPQFRMPYKLDPLTNEQIRLIRSWIAQGAKNN